MTHARREKISSSCIGTGISTTCSCGGDACRRGHNLRSLKSAGIQMWGGDFTLGSFGELLSWLSVDTSVSMGWSGRFFGTRMIAPQGFQSETHGGSFRNLTSGPQDVLLHVWGMSFMCSFSKSCNRFFTIARRQPTSVTGRHVDTPPASQAHPPELMQRI